ncbi:MAG: hypothetical protein A2539_10165 [Elusimicrobia bacterium RIFOXYD2_FULL_34_15]|nr:MAG: hypothetical protein A2539_10165 [Elusimicrobia bacterium RIFOXYD2_FULL_34_15]
MKTRIIVLILLSILAMQVIFSSKQKCAYYDEPFQISAGLYHIKYNDYRIEIQNPPLIRILTAIPLLFTNLTLKEEPKSHWTSFQKYTYGKEFLYKNNLGADTILFLSRLQILGLSILLGLLIFIWASKIFNDEKCGLFALAFYCFSPNILAFSGIAGTDLGITFFILLSLYAFKKYIDKPSLKNIIFSGVCLGLAFSSKFSAILLIPIFILFTILKKDIFRNLINIFLIFIIAFSIITIIYLGNLNLFIEGLKSVFGIMEQKGVLTFLNGNYSDNGFKTYYIFAFLIKSTLPVIILTILSILCFKKIPASSFDKFYILIPVLLFFAAASNSKTQIGLRYILPVYPLIFIYFSGFLKTKLSGVLHYLLYVLLGFHIFCSIKTYPHYLAYFNELIGGPKNGYKYLVDSNLDWGQDLKFLKKYLNNKNVNLVECYFGQGDTKYEGIKGQHILSGESSPDVDYTKKERTDLLAISATYFQGIYIGQTDVFGWLKTKKPIANIGYSILVYDITNDSESHQKLGDLFLYGLKNQEAAKKEYSRAKEILK